MITRATLSTIEQGLPKYRSMLAGNSAFMPGAFESIATFTIATNTPSITFTSIPQTYQHLQIRCLTRTTGTSTGFDELRVRINGNTSTSHSYGSMRGNGSTVTGTSSSATVRIVYENVVPRNGNAANFYGNAILDFNDYAQISKNRTVRGLAGGDLNGTGAVMMGSGALYLTTAISSIELYPDSNSWEPGSSFALYGIKGA